MKKTHYPSPISRVLRELTAADDLLIATIVARYRAELDLTDSRREASPLLIQLDLATVHVTNGLDLVALAWSPAAELVREVVSIRANLNRETGQLVNGYKPRFASTEVAA